MSMKKLFKLSFIGIIFLLSSCKTGNFNKQKFTDLKPAKTEYQKTNSPSFVSQKDDLKFETQLQIC